MQVDAFVTQHQIPVVAFKRGQRKDDVAAEYRARFQGSEGVLFLGKAQEKVTVFRTEKRTAPNGKKYPWLVKSATPVNQFYFYCIDEDFGPFFLKSLTTPNCASTSGPVFLSASLSGNTSLAKARTSSAGKLKNQASGVNPAICAVKTGIDPKKNALYTPPVAFHHLRASALMARHAWLASLAAAAALLSGCVERRFVVTSDPPGAIVLVDNKYIGATPADDHFVYYGKRHFTLMAPGYKTLQVDEKIPTPWYQWFPLDFVSEALVPWQIEDVHRFHYKLESMQAVRPDELANHAQELRNRGRSIGPPPGTEATPPVAAEPGSGPPNLPAEPGPIRRWWQRTFGS